MIGIPSRDNSFFSKYVCLSMHSFENWAAIEAMDAYLPPYDNSSLTPKFPPIGVPARERN